MNIESSELSTLIDVLRGVLNTSLYIRCYADVNVRGLHPASIFHLHLSCSRGSLLRLSSSALRLRNPDKWYAGRYHLSVLAFVVFAVSQSRRVMRVTYPERLTLSQEGTGT